MAVVVEAPRCVASVTGGDEAWRDAVAKLEATLGSDCRKIDVQVHGKGAVVVYVALDGRVAVRSITGVEELAPTVEALRVSLPMEPDTALPPPVKLPPPSKTAELVTPPAPPPPPSPAPRLALALYGGARAGWPGTFVSPLLGASGSLGLGAWSLGIYGEWEASYTSRSTPIPPGFQLFAVAGGFSFGRRFDHAWTVELRVGGAVVSEEGSEADEVAGDDRAEARLGLHVRTAFPASSPVRGRLGLGIEVSPSVLARSKRSVDAGLPQLPVWALVLTVGFEADASGSQ